MALNPKQEEFCYEYCANGYNAAEAYRTVYKNDCKTTVLTNSSKLLHKPDVEAFIKEIRKDKLAQMRIDADRITEKLGEIAFANKGDDYYNASAQLKALEILQKQFNTPEVKNIIEIGLK